MSLFVFWCVPLSAINLNLTAADIDRALVIARQRDGERARFHAPYIKTLDDPIVQSVEIVTEFRRVVLMAEDHILKGDRGFAYSARQAEEAVQVWKRRVSVIARLRFHPLNTYVNVPEIDVTLDGPRAEEALFGVLKDPILALSPGGTREHVPLLGAVADASFDAAIIGQTTRNVTVTLDGKPLTTLRVDFSAIE